MRNLLIFVFLFIGIVGGIVYFGRVQNSSSGPSVNGTQQQVGSIPEVTDTDHFVGNPNANVVIVEYSDFQCPGCKSAYPVVKELIVNNIEKVKFVYRHFPLTTIHKHAESAAYASEAAAKQGKFWEMHDKLFDNQDQWSKSKDPVVHYLNYAADLQLNLDQFSTDMENQEVKDKVARDLESALAANLPGTPSLFVNGGKYDLNTGIAPLQGLIDQLAGEDTSVATESGQPN